jgi:hypothetical protein
LTELNTHTGLHRSNSLGNMINYQHIHDSVQFYENAGFKRVESPWTVTEQISKITAPPGVCLFSIKEKNKVLVASGEQSFLALYNKGFLPKGKFQTVTPCFRDESFDSLHTKYFIKNELIRTDVVTEDALHDLIACSIMFFSGYFVNDIRELKVVETGKNMYDIVFKDVELGSYGIRKCDFLTWIYGTGVAEPRLSRTMEMYGI